MAISKPRKVSLSLSGHCKMELWLIEQGREPEPHLPAVLRLFEYGDLIESLLFQKITVPTADGPEEVGGWLEWADEVSDPVSGFSFDPKKVEVTNRQKEVTIAGSGRKITGHIDGLIHLPDGERLLVDVKSANSFSFERAMKEDLTKSVFSRELVVAQNMYMHALREDGYDIKRGILLYVSKEKATLGCRVLPYDPAMVAEGADRLIAGLGAEAPEPDYAWTAGTPIPLRCGYCDMKQQCAAMRGSTLELQTKKGKPEWIPKMAASVLS